MSNIYLTIWLYLIFYHHGCSQWIPGPSFQGKKVCLHFSVKIFKICCGPFLTLREYCNLWFAQTLICLLYQLKLGKGFHQVLSIVLNFYSKRPHHVFITYKWDDTLYFNKLQCPLKENLWQVWLNFIVWDLPKLQRWRTYCQKTYRIHLYIRGFQETELLTLL